MIEQCQHLSPREQESHLNILKISEYLFDGTLGTWNTATLDLELNDDVKPVWLRTNPVPRVHKAMFRNEVEILVKLGVIEEANDSEW